MDRNAVAFALMLALAGCSASESTPRAETTGSAMTVVRLPVLPAGGDSIHVAAVGALEVEGECLYLRASDGTRTLPVFAIEGIRWNAATATLEAKGRSFRPGQTVTLTGMPADALPRGVSTPCNAQHVFVASAIASGGV